MYGKKRRQLSRHSRKEGRRGTSDQSVSTSHGTETRPPSKDDPWQSSATVNNANKGSFSSSPPESPVDVFADFRRRSRQTRIRFDDFLSPAVVDRRYTKDGDQENASETPTASSVTSQYFSPPLSSPGADFRRVLEGMENIRLSRAERSPQTKTTRKKRGKKKKKKRSGVHKITVRTFDNVRIEDVRSILKLLNVAEDCMYEGFRSARIRTDREEEESEKSEDVHPARRWTTQKRFRVVQVMLNCLEGCFKRGCGDSCAASDLYMDWYGVPKLTEILSKKLELGKDAATTTTAENTMISSEDIVEHEKRRMRDNMKMLRRASFVGRNSIMMNNLLMLRHQEFAAEEEDDVDRDEDVFTETGGKNGAAKTRKSSVVVSNERRRRISSMLAPRLSVLPCAMSRTTITRRPSATGLTTTSRRNTFARRLSHLRTSLLPLPSDAGIIDQLIGKKEIDTTISSRALVSLALSAGVLEFLAPGELLHVAPTVSTAWRREARRVRSWQAAQISAHVVPVDLLDCWTQLCENFPCGKFLAEGAYKRVFQVFVKPANRAEAVAVMNVRRICEDGQADMVRRELNAGLLLGELSSERVCPHYVEWYQIFQFAYPPPESLWASERGEALLKEHLEDTAASRDDRRPPPPRRRRRPRRKIVANDDIPDEPEEERGVWQYIRMELCDGADAEAMLRKRCETKSERDEDEEEGVAFVRECAAMLFQMIVSLRVGIERFHLRHYDIKLLNFMLQSRTSSTTYSILDDSKMEEDAEKMYERYVVSADASRYVVKLADWGTAEMNSETIGRPIESAHYTTLENAPPEFMVLGSNGATQGYETDAWAIGLCWLHLLARDAPYEELMDDVICPPSLFRSLQRLWCDPRDKESGFRVLWLGALEYTPNVRTLADTLWRQIVLCGSFSTLCGSDDESEVVALLRRSFGLDESGDGKGNPTRRTKRRVLQTTTLFGRGEERGRGIVWSQYVKDRKQWCLERGENPHVRAIRSRAAVVAGGMYVLKGFLDLNPATRLSVADVLRDGGSGLFESLRVDAEEEEIEERGHAVVMRL